MKIIFLDIDGVLNSKSTCQRHRGVTGIDPFTVAIFHRIISATDAQIVLSSSWRRFPDGRVEIEKRVMKCLDITPSSKNGFRGDEIREWLANHPEVQRYAILDDGSDFHEDQPHFKTTWDTGLTEETATKVIEYLNETSAVVLNGIPSGSNAG
jgi:hypothetical protein